VIGYRIGETNIKLNEPSSTLAIKIPRTRARDHTVTYERFAKHVTICNPHTKNVDLPPFAPCTKCVTSQISAAIHRLGRKMDQPEIKEEDDILAYGKALITKWFPRGKDEDAPNF